jgi:hypothetical protein
MPTTHTNRLDFDGDTHADILWQNANGGYGVWHLSADGKSVTGAELLQPPADAAGPEIRTVLDTLHTTPVWAAPGSQVVGSGDFNADASPDLLSQWSDGTWASSGTQVGRKIPPQGVGALDHALSPDWKFQGVGDFNGDHKTDILFRGGSDATVGTFLLEEINAPLGTTAVMHGTDLPFQGASADWSVAKLADFDGDGHTDILWRHDGGTVGVWLMDGNQVKAMVAEPNPGAFWSIVDAQDYNGDGKADIFWRGADGRLGEWFMNGTDIVDLGTTLPNPGTDWSPLGI